jgi:hypothetical protein
MTALPAEDRASGYDPKGRRDPFVPLVGSGKAVVTGMDEILSVDDIVLEGIAMGAGGKRIAIINSRLVKENDKIGSARILKITDTAVTVSIDEKHYTVDLKERGGTEGEAKNTET